ncbi:MAG: peptidoglycan-binding protein [Clostridiaceae bacterium]
MYKFGNPGFDLGHHARCNAGPGTYREGDAMLLFGDSLRKKYKVFTTRMDGNAIDLYSRAKKIKDAGCNTMISLHTNAPEDAVGIIVIYSLQRPGDKALAEYIGQELAKTTGLEFRGAKTRQYPNKPGVDYYGIIRYAVSLGMEHAIIVEHGSHWEFAVDIESKIQQCVECYGRIFDLKEVETLKYCKLRRYGSYVHTVEMDPDVYRLDITEGMPGKLEKLSSMYGEPRLDEITWVRMNAQYFGSSSRGYGAFIDSTDNLQDKEPSSSYENLSCINGRLIIGIGGDFTIGTSYGIIRSGVTNYSHSEPFKAIMAAKHPRSMAGSLSSGNNAFVVVDGRWKNLSLGVTAEQQAALGHELSFVDLVNFDGGGSSQIMVGDKILNHPSDGGERAIISAIVAYRKYTQAELLVLKKGNNGVYVNLLQRLLNDAGFNCGTADGIFGNNTLAAVKAYQTKYKLTVDGIVGKQTWANIATGLI